MSTYHSIHFHVIFSTKCRRPWIDQAWRSRLHEYLGGTVRGLDAKPIEVGGIDDHVHLLIGCKTTHRISDLVREIKKAATSWIHQEIGLRSFAWQSGYAAISVSPDACSTVASYIKHQPEHHRRTSFQEELIRILDRANIEYDPMYLD